MSGLWPYRVSHSPAPRGSTTRGGDRGERDVATGTDAGDVSARAAGAGRAASAEGRLDGVLDEIGTVLQTARRSTRTAGRGSRRRHGSRGGRWWRLSARCRRCRRGAASGAPGWRVARRSGVGQAVVGRRRVRADAAAPPAARCDGRRAAAGVRQRRARGGGVAAAEAGGCGEGEREPVAAGARRRGGARRPLPGLCARCRLVSDPVASEEGPWMRSSRRISLRSGVDVRRR